MSMERRMTPRNNWQQPKCKVKGCVFRVWKDSAGVCYGHYKKLIPTQVPAARVVIPLNSQGRE